MVSQKSPYLDEVTEADAVPSFSSIELALKGFRNNIFNDLKVLTMETEKSINRRNMNDTNGNNIMSTSMSTDSCTMQEKEKEYDDSDTYPTSCRFCDGMLRAIDKYRVDRKLTLQCRNRICMKFNGLTDMHAKQFLSEMAKPKAPEIDYGWYLSDPVRHSYGIFANHGVSSDLEVNRSNVNVQPIIQDGNIMLPIFGQTRLARLL